MSGADDPLLAADAMAVALGLTPPVAQPLSGQIAMASGAISRLIRDYCGRSFTRATYVERFFPEQRNAFSFINNRTFAPPVMLTETPVESVVACRVGNQAVSFDSHILHSTLGRLHLRSGVGWPAGDEPIEVEYVGGYDPLPADLAYVLVEMTRRQLGASGVNLGASAAPTAPVRGVSIGSLRVDYAVSLTSDAVRGAASPLTVEGLKPFEMVLDLYRSYRTRMAVS